MSGHTTHGHALRGKVTATYRAWLGMRDRVARDPDYALVRISPLWDDYATFLRDMGEKPAGLTLDRVQNTRGYEPGNCRWATRIEQANNKTTNVKVEFRGRVQTLKQWALELGVNYKTLHNRITACGWSTERALSMPHRGWNKGGRV